MATSFVKSNATAAPDTTSSPSYTPSLGTNLESVSYYSSAMPLLDLMKSASAWIPQTSTTYNTGEQLNLDSNGWVVSIPAAGGTATYDRIGIAIVRENAGAVPHALYDIMYSGQGTLNGVFGTTIIASQSSPGHLLVAAADDGSVQLQLLSTDPNHTGNYIRDIHVVRDDLLPFYNAGLIFNPNFISKVENFHTLRFMDWMLTNQIFDHDGNPINYDAQLGWTNVNNAPLLNWADRPLMTDAQWSHGVPVEAMVAAANLAGVDVWFNMPVNASDDYVKQFALYVKQHLDPDLKIHIEYSNEVWNFGFQQAHYATAQAALSFGGQGNWMEWYGMRAAQVGVIWKDVFGEPETGPNTNGRISVVFNTQFDYRGLELYGLDTPDWVDKNGVHIQASNYFNEYAVTGYYGGFLSDDNSVGLISQWMNSADPYTAAINALKSYIETVNAPGYVYHDQQAVAHGLQLVTYEGGFGAQTPASVTNNPAFTSFLINLQRDPRIYALEQENISLFKAAGGGLYMNFEAIASPSVHGSWGALETILQTTSPRYAALSDWNAAIAPWYDTGRSAVSFQNARIYHATDSGEVVAGTLHGYDVLVGGNGNDTFVPYGTGASIDGGAGFNTVILPGALSSYTLVTQPDGSILVTGGGLSFSIKNVQMLIDNVGLTSATGVAVAQAAVTTPPLVISVHIDAANLVSGSGVLHVNDVATITLQLSQVVSVFGGQPTLTLSNGAIATFAGGSGTGALTFTYKAAAGDSTSDLGVAAVNLNGATISTGSSVISPGSGQSLTDSSGHVFSFGASSGGADYQVLRDGVSFGYGAGHLLALIGNTIWTSTASGWYAQIGSGWVFQPVAPSIAVGTAAVLLDAVTNPSGTLIVDTPAATPAPAGIVVTSVVASGSGISAGSGIVHTGAAVTFTLNMSQAVAVSTTSGVPTLVLDDGGIATYSGGSGTNALTFNYTVAAGQTSADLHVTAVKLNGATIGTGSSAVNAGSGLTLTDASGHVFSFGAGSGSGDYPILRDGVGFGFGAGRSLVLVNGTVWTNTSGGWYAQSGSGWAYQPTAPTLSNGTAADLSGALANPAGILQVDTTSAVPTQPSGVVVTSVTASGAGISAGAGVLHAGAVVTFTLNMSQAVSVLTANGLPTLVLDDGGIATYAGGSGTNALTFTHTVAAGQTSADLHVTDFHLNGALIGTGSSSTIAPGSGLTLTDTGGHVFSFGAGSSGDIPILRDGVSFGYGAGHLLALVNGTVWTDTASGWYAQSGSGWAYQPTAPTLSNGTAADLSGAVANPSGILQVDTSSAAAQPAAIAVTSIVTSGDGISAGTGVVHAGAVVTFTLNMSQVVSVSTAGGLPTLVLDDGGTATYSGGSGTQTLTFTHTVAAGQTSADLRVTDVHLNGATVGTGSAAITPGAGLTLTDAGGHIFSFGAATSGGDNLILRDYVSFGFGAGHLLTMVNGTAWTDTTSGWYAQSGSGWAHQSAGPTLSSGTAADLSGAIANPAGILQVDTTHTTTTATTATTDASTHTQTLVSHDYLL